MYKPYWALNWGAGPVPKAGSPVLAKIWLFYQVMKQRSCVMNAVKNQFLTAQGRTAEALAQPPRSSFC